MFEELSVTTDLVPYSPGESLGDFDCGIEDYNKWINYDAQIYIDRKVSSVWLLKARGSDRTIAYMALCADSIPLDKDEKNSYGLTKEDGCEIGSIPALKIGKLAVDRNYRGRNIGRYLVELSLGFTFKVLEAGCACRFITVDADVEDNPGVDAFYKGLGFEYNQHKLLTQTKKGEPRKTISMRLDVYGE